MTLMNETVRQLTDWFAHNRRAAAGQGAVTVLYAPSSLVILQVFGRKTRRIVLVPLALLPHQQGRYLVSMLGEKADWVRNVRAAGGEAVLYNGDRESVRLVEVPVTQRLPILLAYLKASPGAQVFIPAAGASLAELAALAAGYPVFRVEPR